jgi:hypothetical protein
MAVCTIALFQKDILTASKHLVLKVTLIILTIQFIQPPRILLLGAVILSSCVFLS